MLWTFVGSVLVEETTRTLKPFGPRIDQHQFSPNNIVRSSRVKIMRITKLITRGRMPLSLTKFSQLFFKEMCGDQFEEFVTGYRDLMG